MQSVQETPKKEKGTFYFGWGYNRDWFTKSNIHLQNNTPQLINGTNYTYDFTVYNTKANDRPQFDKIKDVANLTVPQFNFRIGYYFKKRKNIGIELNYDHAKYVATEYQKARIKGQINGNYFDKDTILDPNKFLEFEHTDGANFWMINLLFKYDAWQSKNKKHRLSLVVKPGLKTLLKFCLLMPLPESVTSTTTDAVSFFILTCKLPFPSMASRPFFNKFSITQSNSGPFIMALISVSS